jgi:hypothetical protein
LSRFQVLQLPAQVRSSGIRVNPEPGGLRHMVSAAGYFCLTVLISYYYAATLTLIMAIVVARQAVILRKETSRIKALSAHLFVFTALTATLLAPFVVPALIQMARGDYHFTIEAASSGDLVSYFIPDTTLAYWQGWAIFESAARWAHGINASLGGHILEKSVCPGWTGRLAILSVAVWPGLRRRYWPWALLAASFFILLIGPTLHFKGSTYLEGLMPYRALSTLPLFGVMRSPSRISIFITLGAGLIVDGGCLQIKQVCSRHVYRMVALGLGLFILCEFLPVQGYLTPNSYYRSPYYRQLAGDPESYAIVNIPLDFSGAGGAGTSTSTPRSLFLIRQVQGTYFNRARGGEFLGGCLAVYTGKKVGQPRSKSQNPGHKCRG